MTATEAPRTEAPRTVNELAERLTALSRQSYAAWDMTDSDLRKEGDVNKASECRYAWETAHGHWYAAIRAASGGCRELLLRAVDELEQARGLADEWGGYEEEAEALELLSAALEAWY